MLSTQLKTVKKYPHRKPWDYIANVKEDAELERIASLKKTIDHSKAAFEAGLGEQLTAAFFERFKQ